MATYEVVAKAIRNFEFVCMISEPIDIMQSRNESAMSHKGDEPLGISSNPSQWRAFLKEMRPHQYLKNTLIAVPLLTAHQYLDAWAAVSTCLAFLCFSLCASGIYFFNDLIDLPADRAHPTKRNRPLASGALRIELGILGAVLLPAMAFALALVSLPISFTLVLFAYLALTTTYSLILKRVGTADIVTLALLYTLRVVAGAAATGIALSSWLLAFSMFVFVSLSYLKRYIELANAVYHDSNVPGRGYSAQDCETMFSLGTANMTASVVIMAMYISSDEVTAGYNNPEVLWLLCLLLLYWGNRIWIGARRGKIADDPVLFAIRDRISRWVGAGFVLVTLVARYA